MLIYFQAQSCPYLKLGGRGKLEVNFFLSVSYFKKIKTGRSSIFGGWEEEET